MRLGRREKYPKTCASRVAGQWKTRSDVGRLDAGSLGHNDEPCVGVRRHQHRALFFLETHHAADSIASVCQERHPGTPMPVLSIAIQGI